MATLQKVVRRTPAARVLAACSRVRHQGGYGWQQGGGGGGFSQGGGGGFRGQGGYVGRGGGRGGRGAQFYYDPQIDWNASTLTPFEKDFYVEHPEVSKYSEQDVSEMRTSAGMLIFGDGCPKPFSTFEQSGVPAEFLQHLERMNIKEPTPIQRQGIPIALSGRNMVGVSRTGSGKTLAYLLPAILHINAQAPIQQGEGPIALVLAPTRELCQQIDNEIDKFCRSGTHVQIRHVALYGGSDKMAQIRGLAALPDIVVATPGRLIDLLQNGKTNFRRTTYLVLDEADRMLDMGFREPLENILKYVRPDRQVLMWSATWPREIQHIAGTYMTNPLRVQIGSTELHANQNIDQYFKALHTHEKQQAIMQDAREIVQNNKKALIFVNTKRDVQYLEDELRRAGVPSAGISGDKVQTQRDLIMRQFRSNQVKVLIATDVVARGIDIRDIGVVINYDMPKSLEDYVHRIGRTGRALDKGMALAYVTHEDMANLGNDLVNLLQKSKQDVPTWMQQQAAAGGYRQARHYY